jgi:RNA polymerase sigma-70 factor (ECF subfamily)
VRKSGVDHDIEDFAEFYDRARDGCLRAVYAATGDRHTAEELTAEAFARACVSWRKVRRHPAPAAWVVRTALNTHISWWRKRRREVTWTEGFDPAGSDPAPPDPRVLAALKALPPRQREVVALRILLDLDTETTARELGVSPGTVKTHLSRALAALRAQLGPERNSTIADHARHTDEKELAR